MSKIIDLTGQKFGRLTVIKRATNNHKGNARWHCQCDCGKEKIIVGLSLRNNNTQSCGCLASEKTCKRNITHGNTHTRIFKIWQGIHTRCTNKNCSSYCDYGGRGIRVCQEWTQDFFAFYQWAMSNGYSDELTIDRIDNNGNYEPKNCRWVTRHQQYSNKRNNTDFVGVSFCTERKGFVAYLKIDGKYVLHKRFKIKDDAVKARLNAEQQFGIKIQRKEKIYNE